MERQRAIDLAEHWFRNSHLFRGMMRTTAEIDASGRWVVEIEGTESDEAVVLHIHADGKLGDEIVYLQVCDRS